MAASVLQAEKAADFFEAVKNISVGLESGKELLTNQYISEFQDMESKMRDNINGIMEEKRTMKIGIVGEVKAGKSSFLNALLFDGEDVLPKAPTPMTAALTKISYSETPVTKIHFYNNSDWSAVEEKDRRYKEMVERDYAKYTERLEERKMAGIEGRISADVKSLNKMSYEEFEKKQRKNYPVAERSCHELIEMVRSSGIDALKYLSDEPKIISAKDTAGGYMNALQDYVGSNGRFTPIVKYTEIQLNNDMLKGIEVIDTPGMNDPIISRSFVTKDFLDNCDVVFMLSYSGQFLGEEDLNFLTSNLSSAGISRAVVIGSKFDSGVLDYPEQRASFEEAYVQSRKNLLSQAHRSFAQFESGDAGKLKVIQKLRETDPEFVSSLFYGAAKHKRNGVPYSSEEKFIIERFKERFRDFNDSVEILSGFSNIDDVKENTFKKVEEDKAQILEERRNDIFESYIGRFMGLLEDLSIQTETMIDELKNSDVEMIEKRLADITDGVNSSRVQVKALFENAANTVFRSANEMVIELKKESLNHLQFDVEKKTDVEEWDTTSGHLWWKKKTHHVNTIHTNLASVNDVTDNIRAYQIKAMEIINERFKSIIKMDTLKTNISNAVMGMFDLSARDFNPASVTQPLESALQRIVIPELDFDTEKYMRSLAEQLSGKVSGTVAENDEINYLKIAQSNVMDEISKDLINNVKAQCKKAGESMEKQGATFIDGIINQLEETADNLRTMLEDKKGSMEKLESFNASVKEYKSVLRKLG